MISIMNQEILDGSNNCSAGCVIDSSSFPSQSMESVGYHYQQPQQNQHRQSSQCSYSTDSSNMFVQSLNDQQIFSGFPLAMSSTSSPSVTSSSSPQHYYSNGEYFSVSSPNEPISYAPYKQNYPTTPIVLSHQTHVEDTQFIGSHSVASSEMSSSSTCSSPTISNKPPNFACSPTLECKPQYPFSYSQVNFAPKANTTTGDNGINVKMNSSMNDLVRVIDLSNMSDDKANLPNKVKQLLIDHFQSQAVSTSNLMTPPLSPNNETFFYTSKPPRFPNSSNSTPTSTSLSSSPSGQTAIPNATYSYSMNEIKSSSDIAIDANSNLVEMKIPMIKVEPTVDLVNSMPNTTASTGGNVLIDSTGGQIGSEEHKFFDQNNSIQVEVTEGMLPQSSFELATKSVQSSKSGIRSKCVSNKTNKMSKVKGLDSGDKSISRIKTSNECGQQPHPHQHHNHPPHLQQKQSQKRTAHLSAEFRYRTKLNDKINRLRNLVSKHKHNLSKSAVLTRSIEMIIKLQKLTVHLHQVNMQLQNALNNNTSTSSVNLNNSPGNSLNEQQNYGQTQPINDGHKMTTSLKLVAHNQPNELLSKQQSNEFQKCNTDHHHHHQQHCVPLITTDSAEVFTIDQLFPQTN